MRLLVEKILVPASLALALAGCGRAMDTPLASRPAPQGPAADYPVVVGDPFTVDGALYTPVDTLNYDAVGAAGSDPDGRDAISGQHRTLPLPSYVEVTSLDTGRTILVRLERRGPMHGSNLIGLSPGALAQLGASEGTPVRVRRVNPPEQERAMLRRGEHAPERMETPKSLVEVLRRRLPPAIPAAKSLPVGMPPLKGVETLPTAGSAADIGKAAEPAPSAAGYMVQAGAFSIEVNARKVADRIGGRSERAGTLFLVRTGPFASRAQAVSSLAKVRDAGYSDARILSVR